MMYRGFVGKAGWAAKAGRPIQYLMPFFMIRFLHASPMHTGLTLLAYPLAMGLTAPAGGLLADRWSAHRTALCGAAPVATADLLLAEMGSAGRPADLAWRLALVGLGMGLFSGANQSTIMGLAPREALATAGASTGLSRSLGFALGPALGTLIWASGGYSASALRIALLLPLVAATTAGILLGTTRLISSLRNREGNRATSPPSPPIACGTRQKPTATLAQPGTARPTSLTKSTR